MAGSPLASSKAIARIQAKALRDSAFRRKLLKNARKALIDEGFRLPPGVRIKVVQNTPVTFYLVLPAKPAKARKPSRRPKRPGRMGPQFTIPV